MSLKNPVTRPGIDPGTVRLVAQRRNHYATPDKITTHPNELAFTLLEEEKPSRLKRFKPTDVTTRFS
jgi:hypothetical protein